MCRALLTGYLVESEILMTKNASVLDLGACGSTHE